MRMTPLSVCGGPLVGGGFPCLGDSLSADVVGMGLCVSSVLSSSPQVLVNFFSPSFLLLVMALSFKRGFPKALYSLGGKDLQVRCAFAFQCLLQLHVVSIYFPDLGWLSPSTGWVVE